MKLVVVYSSDNNYSQHTGVSIVSLLDNNKHFDVEIKYAMGYIIKLIC